MKQPRLTLPALALFTLVSMAAAADLPRPSHELTVNMNDGSKLLLSQYKGKVVAVCFILTGCSHCQKTVGFLNKLQKEYAPKGFQVLSAAIEENAADHVPNFIKQFNVPFPVGTTDPTTAINWMQHPPMLAPHMPLLAFVDRQGAVRSQFEGDNEKFFNDQQEQNLREQIEGLLKESAAKKASPHSSAVKK